MSETKITINYYELMDTIIDGILRHDLELFMGELLIKGRLNPYNLENEEEIQKKLRQRLNGMAYNVLTGITEKFPQIEIDTNEPEAK